MINNLKPQFFDELRKEAANIYSTQQEIRVVITTLGMKPGVIDLQGAAIQIWDSVLGSAEVEGKLEALVEYMHKEFSVNKVFKKVLDGIRDRSALIETINITDFIKPNPELAAKTLLVYDLDDDAIVKSLRKQLYPLEQFAGEIKLTDIHQDSAGFDRDKRQLELVGEAEIILLMLTPSFFGNPDNNCLKLALNGFEMKKTVVPVLLSNTLWGRIKILSDIVPLPINGKPVSQWGDKEEALVTIAEGVSRIAQRLKKKD